MNIYLDVCCLNRPFDDQSQDRVHLESEAIILILNHIRTGKWKWISSEVVNYEVSKIPDVERRHRIETLLRLAGCNIGIEEAMVRKASELQSIGFGVYDALHLACAEYGGADIFLTTDDQVVQLARRSFVQLMMKVENPLRWLKEDFDDEYKNHDA